MATNLTTLVEQLQALLPSCNTGFSPCIEEAPSGRGFALYVEDGDRVCDSLILLPGFNLLPQWLLGAVYLIFLLYLFAGVAIASDMFMDGIVNICATTRKVKRKNQHGVDEVVEVPVWNWVVANISLMALGTSSPEIMLATVEAVLSLGKPAGELGPACIAGSAAYNFLMISAVCTLAIPAGQFKRISQLRVYITTAIWSLWAYVWMLVVYTWWTPDEVTLAEALLTLGMFFIMVFNAWIVDTEPWKKNKVVSTPPPELDLEKHSAIGSEAAGDVDSAIVDAPVKTLAHYRHLLAARQRNHAARKAGHDGEHGEIMTHSIEPIPDHGLIVEADPHKEQVLFRSNAYSFLESVGTARIAVVRIAAANGSLDQPLRVHYKTEDGDAVAGLDYTASEGTLHFAPGEASKYIEVVIIDDDACEPDVHFSVVLTSAERPGGDERGISLVQPRVRVTIVDDDDAGVLGFELPEVEVAFNVDRPYAEVAVVRRRGADGRVQVAYETQDMTAAAGQDYTCSSGIAVFESGEKSHKIRVNLLPSFVPETHKSLRVVLKNPEGGAELGKRSACKVTLVNRALTVVRGKQGVEMGSTGVTGSVKLVKSGSDKGDGSNGAEWNVWTAWKEQIMDAFSPDGGDDDDEEAEVGWGGLIMQYVNITWKLILFTAVPPAKWKGGYPCFFSALGMIIGIVYLVNEAGSLFGCIIGLKEVMVGVSIVAVGTSLPDTLASRIAAVQDKDADAAIGNITGSNGVNVFLGLGLPWTICSIYYTVRGEKYVTPGGDLEFAIMLYAIFGCCGIVILAVARYFGGELGGSKRRQWSIAGLLTGLWLLYLILSGLRAYGNI